MNNKVGIKRCERYDLEELYLALKEAAMAAGFPDAAGKTVLLKPNIVTDVVPERAVTTHPVFLAAVIRLVREWGASRILVGDSPGIQKANFTASISGLGETATKNGAEWVDFTRGRIELDCPAGKVHRRFSLSDALKDVDMVISLPKLKSHELMYFTGAMKNLFGFIPSVVKSSYHLRYRTRKSFASMLVDLNIAVKPAYAFMDAVVAMEGPGPNSGTPRHLGLVLASSNLLAMDAAACGIIGYPPEMIPVNQDALARQIWLKNFSDIEYPLLKPDDVSVNDFVKIPFKKKDILLLDFLLPRPLRNIGMKRNTNYTNKDE
jgi:uncharacterized protein (DUF362 family)